MNFDEIEKNRLGGSAYFASYQQIIHLPKTFISYFEGYDMPLQSESKVTLLGCWPLEIFGTKIAEFEALVKVIKTASYFRCRQIMKSK